MEVTQDNPSKMRICMLLSLQYESNMLVYPTIWILSYLTNFGHHVTWVITSQKDLQIKEFPLGDVKVYTIPYRRYLPGSSTLVGALNRILNAISRIRSASRIFRDGKYDLVFVRDSALDGLIAAYIQKRHKVPFIFELSNPLQSAPVDMIEQKKFRFLHYGLIRFGHFVCNKLLHRADLILPISKWLGKDLIEQSNIPNAKVMPLPEGADIKVFSDRDGNSVREELCLQDAKVIIYIGSITEGRGLDILIQAFTKVIQKRGAAKLLMVGDATNKANLEELAMDLGVNRDVIFTGRVPQSKVPDFIAAADVGVSPVPPTSFYRVSSPIKMFEYMASAKPVVANEEILEHKEVLLESEGGIVVPYTPEDFSDAIMDLLDNPAKASEMGRRGREWVTDNRSYEVLARQVEKRYLELLE